MLARHAGADVVVVDIGVDHDFTTDPGVPALHTCDSGGRIGFGKGGTAFITNKVVRGTGNIARGPALTRQQAEQCIQIGMDIVKAYAGQGYTMFATGDMGIANTTPSSAIISVLSGKPAAAVTGKGTGIDDDAFRHKVRVIEQAIAFNKPDPDDAIDVLAKIGGAEIGGIAGVILGCALNRVPVVVDGLISGAGALIAYSIEPRTKDYMFMAHNSVEQGHKAVHEKTGLKPILDLNLRLGEGTGAALAMQLIEAGMKIYREMATFGEAGVSEKAGA